MKTKELLKFTAIAVITVGFAVGCTSDSSETMEPMAEECMGATPEVKNAIYAAKLKNARVRNLGLEWRDTAKTIAAAEKAAEECDNDRASTLANKAESEASDAIAQYHADQEMTDEPMTEAVSMSMGNYIVSDGDNLWNIAGQASVYGNPYQWPLIFKNNSAKINDADLIYAGQTFDIPKASDAEIAAAVEHAKTRGAWVIGEAEASDINYLAQ
jgi:nucleoid-associated protein YgaU